MYPDSSVHVNGYELKKERKKKKNVAILDCATSRWSTVVVRRDVEMHPLLRRYGGRGVD